MPDASHPSSENLTQRLAYLANASRFLALSVPATAAYLATEHTRIIARTGGMLIDVTTTLQACKACGAILIPGLSCRVTVDEGMARSRRQRSGGLGKRGEEAERQWSGGRHERGANGGKVLVTECARCSRSARVPLSPPVASDWGKRQAVVRDRLEIGSGPSDSGGRDESRIHPGGPITGSTLTGQIRDEPIKPPKGIANAGSRQRARLRKRGGLKAVLEKRKAESASDWAPKLGLMDFLKSE